MDYIKSFPPITTSYWWVLNAVRVQLAAYYKLPLNCVLVFHDEMDLPCGVLHLHHKGGHGTHNGLKSVIYHFRGNKEFPRLRIGIGSPPGQMDPKAFLLQKFNAAARERIDAALWEGVDGLKLLLCKGLTESARRFSLGKPKIAKCLNFYRLLHEIADFTSMMSFYW
ncbi:Peptidyl-tRNA hydrolase [Quillaja saponaria]|uniref:Peptidyl-tRNA hydrolase n=1 Tax=Quillaja saponaria TaxID=32244 RepID=A0AAD7LC86_QUISA|nr:Peptidyl-tRNA hydrolase [Quillaja saponaria]